MRAIHPTEENKMTKKQAIKVLKWHNLWRRGAEVAPSYATDPKTVGEAIDTAIRLLSKPEKRRAK